jgi:hypothetical protein
VLQLTDPLAAALGVLEYVRDRPPVLAGQASERREPLFDLLQPSGCAGGIQITRAPDDIRRVAPQVPPNLLGVVAQRLYPGGQLVESWIDLAHRLKAVRRIGQQLPDPALALRGDRVRGPRGRLEQRLHVA